MKITIIGSSGRVGRNLVRLFREIGSEVLEFGRLDKFDQNTDYGFVLYCAGVTVDFQVRCLDVVNAHVLTLSDWLTRAEFQKLIYFSSSRVYINNEYGCESVENFIVNKNDTYNQTKLLGESICHYSGKNTSIIRVSNIVGYDPDSPYFLWNILRQCRENSEIILEESELNGRDYVLLEDVFRVLYKIIEYDLTGIFNISSAINLKNIDLISLIKDAVNIKAVSFGDKINNFPCIENKKVSDKTGVRISDPRDMIKKMYNTFMSDSSPLLGQ